jgi:hypothetical protein
MSTPQRIEKPVRMNLTQRLHAAGAKIVENPTFHGEKISGWWLITPVGNFKLRGRGSDTNAAALEMLDLLEGKDPGTMPPSDRTVATATARKRPTTYPPPADS